MNKFDLQRKQALIDAALQAREAARRCLLYVVTDDDNREEVARIEDAEVHIDIALERLTGVDP